MINYEQASKLVRSEKISLVTCEAIKQAKIFQLYSGATYSKVVPHFVSNVLQNGVELEIAPDKDSLTMGTWFFDAKNKTVYVNIVGDGDPKTDNVSIVYKFFFSNTPINLPNDLSSGEAVEWLPLIRSIGSIGQSLDDQNTGIVLESQSNVEFINDGFFDSIYDSLIWENQKISFYSWFNGIKLSENKKIFDGVIESKDFAQDKVNFKVKDYVYKLKNKVDLGLFSSADGDVLDSIIGTPKRRIYGQANQVKTIPIDCIKNGYELTGLVSISSSVNTLTGSASASYINNNLTGTIAGNSGTRNIIGTGTTFLSQIYANQKLKVTNGLVTYNFTVQSVNSNTSITVTSNISATFSGFAGKNNSVGNKKVYGVGTKFLEELQNGNNIQFFSGATTYEYTVESIRSNTEFTVSEYITDPFSSYGIKNLDIKNNVLSGVSTLFLDELSPEDELFVNVGDKEYKYVIESVSSNLTAFITDSVTESVANQVASVKPKIPWRKKNRRWHLAGHKLIRSEAEILTVINARQFSVNNYSDFYTGDTVTINGITTQVTRVSGSNIILEQNIFPVPLSGDIIFKEPILNAYIGNERMVLNRDFTLTNTTEAIIEIDQLAEFNLAKETYSSISLDFENGSNIIRSKDNIDLTTIIQSREWIRSFNQTNDSWFEVLFVEEDAIVIRQQYSEPTNSSVGKIKKVNLISDESLITVDCYGYDNNKWVRTASDCVKHLIQNDAGFANINNDSFDQANADCSYKISMVIPEDIGQEAPMIRDVITKINESVFGSLYGDSSQDLSYSIVNTRRPSTLKELHDDDILSWDTSSDQKIVNKVKINYAPFVDKITGDNSFNVVTYTNEFVDNNVRIKNTIEKTCYLFNEQDATTIAQRYAFYNSLSQSIVNIKAKADFFTSSVNDRVYINFDRLYKRYGESSRRKIGVISSIKKSSYNTEISMNDLGNIFNRCHTLAESATAPFTSATDDEKIKYGFILDPDTLTPDPTSEEDLGSHLIG